MNIVSQEELIAARGGADSMYANDPGKLRACNRWVDHARTIIQAMFVLEDNARDPLVAARIADGSPWDKPSQLRRDMEEASQYIWDAHRRLADMLDGIRDNFIADERCGIGNTDDETEAADEFNDWLDDSTITVDQAIRIATDEHNAAFGRKAA